MQPDMTKVAEKLAIQVANLSMENAKLVTLLEQLQEQATQAEQPKDGN